MMQRRLLRLTIRGGPPVLFVVCLVATSVAWPHLWQQTDLLAQTSSPTPTNRPDPPPGTPAPRRRAAPSALSSQRNGRLFPPLDLGLLEGPDREAWQKPDQIMDALGIADGAVVADLGAGGGWFTLRLARRVGPNGLVYAQDIQPQMIEGISRRVQRENLQNVRTVLGTATDSHLPKGVDAVLIVDAYHEMDEPARPEIILTLLRNIARSLRPQGRVGVVDFMPGGGGPGPSPEERVDPDAVIAAAAAAGLKLQARDLVPPYQFMLVFGKDPAASDPL
jgi:SAM-dependent methyltransferase